MLNLLPVKRSEIVKARYLTMYIVYVGVTLVYILSATALHIIKPNLFAIFNFNIIFLGVLVLSLINAVQIPIYYILDLQKSRIISMSIMFITIIAFTFLLSSGIVSTHISSFLELNHFFQNCIFIFCAVIVYITSSAELKS